MQYFLKFEFLYHFNLAVEALTCFSISKLISSCSIGMHLASSTVHAQRNVRCEHKCRLGYSLFE